MFDDQGAFIFWDRDNFFIAEMLIALHKNHIYDHHIHVTDTIFISFLMGYSMFYYFLSVCKTRNYSVEYIYKICVLEE